MAQSKPRFGLFGKIVLYFVVVGVLTWLVGVLLRCSSDGSPGAARAPTPCVVVFTRPTAVAGYEAVPSAATPCPTQASGQEAPPGPTQASAQAVPCPTQAPDQTAGLCPTQPAPEVVVQECPACPTQHAPQDPTAEPTQAAPPCECAAPQQDALDPTPVSARIELQARPVSGPCSGRPGHVWTVVQWQDMAGSWHDVTGWQGWLDESWQEAWWVEEKDLGTGPFRWALTCDCRCEAWAVSDSFNLPSEAGQTLRVEVVLGG